MGDVVGVAIGRSRREERIRAPEDRPKVDATYVSVLNSLCKSPTISGAECFFLRSASSRSWIGDVVGVATGRSRREERVRAARRGVVEDSR